MNQAQVQITDTKFAMELNESGNKYLIITLQLLIIDQTINHENIWPIN